MEGGMWGGRHIQWAGSTYWAGVNGQARWANGQARWVNGQARWAAVHEWRGWADRGCASARHGSVCESK